MSFKSFFEKSKLLNSGKPTDKVQAAATATPEVGSAKAQNEAEAEKKE